MKSEYGGIGNKFMVKVMRKDPCVFCGERTVYPPNHHKAGKPCSTIDHIHPRSRGGWNDWTNFAPTCSRCNSIKGSNSLLGHLMGVQIPSESEHLDSFTHERWFDPLGIVISETHTVDERFVGLGAKERKVLRAKLADAA